MYIESPVDGFRDLNIQLTGWPDKDEWEILSTAVTNPAAATPGTYGGVTPNASPHPPRICVSTKRVSTASARTTTSPSPGTGSGSSAATRTSGPPYSSTRIARIAAHTPHLGGWPLWSPGARHTGCSSQLEVKRRPSSAPRSRSHQPSQPSQPGQPRWPGQLR
jgi:hypothetical protein